MKQSPIEWMESQLKLVLPINQMNDIVIQDLFKQAKEMERQQIIDARQDGHDSTYAEYGETPKCYLDGSNEQYYNEIFKQK